MVSLAWSAIDAILAGLPVFGALVLALAASQTKTVTLTGPEAKPGELLDLHYDERVDQVVVRRVMDDLTGQHVVLVRPWRKWHRVKWTRRLL